MKVCRVSEGAIANWRIASGVRNQQEYVDRILREAGFAPDLPVSHEVVDYKVVYMQPEMHDLLAWWRLRERYLQIESGAAFVQRELTEARERLAASVVRVAELEQILAGLEIAMGCPPTEHGLSPTIARPSSAPVEEVAPEESEGGVVHLDMQPPPGAVAGFMAHWQEQIAQAVAGSPILAGVVELLPLGAATAPNPEEWLRANDIGLLAHEIQRKIMLGVVASTIPADVALEWDRNFRVERRHWEAIRDL